MNNRWLCFQKRVQKRDIAGTKLVDDMYEITLEFPTFMIHYSNLKGMFILIKNTVRKLRCVGNIW